MDINKLLELVERQIDTAVSDAKYKGNLRMSRDWGNGEGAGHFSRGTPNKNDPHMFKKHGILPLGDTSKPSSTSNPAVDGYDLFVRYLVEHDIDNIHFPNVYSIKKIADPSGKFINKYDVEKLIPLGSLEPDEMQALIDMNFNQRKTGTIYSKSGISSVLNNCVRFYPEDSDHLLLPSLVEACEIARKIMTAEKLALDLHSGNIMLRRTPTGLQIVLNDPFSFKSA